MNPITCILCGLYFETAIQINKPQPTPPPQYTHWLYERTHTRNPYGTLAIGFEHSFTPKLEAFVELRHESSFDLPSDKGEDSFRIGVKYKPFRR